MHKISKPNILIIFIFLLTTLMACNSSNLNQNFTQEEQVNENSNHPFEQLNAAEFFLACENSGGKIQEWEEGWTCNYETEEDILCNQAGDCTFGTAPEITSPVYASTIPSNELPESSQELMIACKNNEGTFFEWDSGFGCDFEEDTDIFCDLNENCGFGWVMELAGNLPINFAGSDRATSNTQNALIASMLQPAFIPVTADNDKGANQVPFQPQLGRALARETILNNFINIPLPTDGSSNTIAYSINGSDDEGNDSIEGNTWDEDDCNISGGTHYPVPDHDGWTACDYEDGGRFLCYIGWPSFCDYYPPNTDESRFSEPGGGLEFACNTFGCSVISDDKTESAIDFSIFQDAFLATDVYFVLGGISDIEPQFKIIERDWNSLYTEIVGINGIIGTNGFIETKSPSPAGPIPIPYPNLPGTVSIIAPNNIVAPNNIFGTSMGFDEADALFGKRGFVLVPNPFGSAFSKTICGILQPPLCFPDLGLIIPATQLTYFINPSDLPLPAQFTWVESLLKVTPSLENDPLEKVSATPFEGIVKEEPITTDDAANCRFGPSINYPIIVILPTGTDATVLGRNALGNWAFVILSDGTECWLWEGTLSEDSDFENADIIPDPPTPTPRPTAVIKATSAPSGSGSIPPTPAPSDPQNASISGTVFKDGNGDGSQNGSDPGYSGVIVNLRSGSCGSTSLTVTSSNSSGGFSFTGLAAGTYCVSVSIPQSCGDYSIATTNPPFTIVLGEGDSSSVSFGFQKKIC